MTRGLPSLLCVIMFVLRSKRRARVGRRRAHGGGERAARRRHAAARVPAPAQSRGHPLARPARPARHC